MLVKLSARIFFLFFFFQAEDGIRDLYVTGVQTCALPISVGATLSAEPVWGMACAALTLQTMRHFSDFTFGANDLNPVREVVQPPLESALDSAGARAAERREAGEAAPPPPPEPLSRRLLASWKGIDRLPGLLWLKKMAAFPIGERFAAI